jgi:hypothetical protein
MESWTNSESGKSNFFNPESYIGSVVGKISKFVNNIIHNADEKSTIHLTVEPENEITPQITPQDMSYLYDAPEFQESQSVAKKNIIPFDTASKLSRRRVNPVLKIMNYITNVKFNGKERYSERRSSAFRRMDDGIDIDLNTKKIINYMDFVNANKDLIKPKPIYPSLNVKRHRTDSMVSEFDQSNKKRRVDTESNATSEYRGLNKIRAAIKDDVSMKSVNSVLTKQSNIEMKSYHSKSLEQIQKEILEKKTQNQKMLDEISERNSRRSLMLIDRESKVDYAEKRKIIANYYKEKSRTTMEDLDLINDNYFTQRGRRPKFEQLSCSNNSLTFEASKKPQKEDIIKTNNYVRLADNLTQQPSFSDGKQITFNNFREEIKQEYKFSADKSIKFTDNLPLPTITEEKEEKKTVLNETKTDLFHNYIASNVKPDGIKILGSFSGLSGAKELSKEETVNNDIKKTDEGKIETKSEIRFCGLFGSDFAKTKSERPSDNKQVSLLNNNEVEKKPEESKFTAPLFKPENIQQKTVEAKPFSSIFSDTSKTTKSEIKIPENVGIFGEKKEETPTKPVEPVKEEIKDAKSESKSLFGSFNLIPTPNLANNLSPTIKFDTQKAETKPEAKAQTKIEITKTEIPKAETKTELKTDSATIKSFNSSTNATEGSKPGELIRKITEKKEEITTLPPIIPKITTPSSSLLLNQNNPFVNPGSSKGGTPNLFKNKPTPETVIGQQLSNVTTHSDKHSAISNIQKNNPFLSQINPKSLDSSDMVISPVLSPQLRPMEAHLPSQFSLNNSMDVNSNIFLIIDNQSLFNAVTTTNQTSLFTDKSKLTFGGSNNGGLFGQSIPTGSIFGQKTDSVFPPTVIFYLI